MYGLPEVCCYSVCVLDQRLGGRGEDPRSYGGRGGGGGRRRGEGGRGGGGGGGGEEGRGGGEEGGEGRRRGEGKGTGEKRCCSSRCVARKALQKQKPCNHFP